MHRNPNRNLTVPNALTVLRIVMALVAAACFLLERHEGMAVYLCIVAALLDIFDGWYARRFSQTSHLGEHLDPLADKLLMAVVYGVIAMRLGSPLVWALIALIALREVGMTVFRSYSLRRHSRFIPANRWGKFKMLLQSTVGLTILGVAYLTGVGFDFHSLALAGLLLPILVVSYVSAAVYLRDWRRVEGFRRATDARRPGERGGESQPGWARVAGGEGP
jgi:CDP-diacylglycerol--glycerol-3-phosphate 3-phosphatidyltransferase